MKTLRAAVVAAVILGPMSQSGSVASAPIGLFNYYCPKSNESPRATPSKFVGSGALQFPETLPHRRRIARIKWEFKDCSNDKYFCLDRLADERVKYMRVFVPRTVELGKMYTFGDARAIATGSQSLNWSRRAQVTVWNSNGLAIKLTLEEGRGVVYLDGINFDDADDFADGDTCILESQKGYFSNVRIVVPTPRRSTD